MDKTVYVTVQPEPSEPKVVHVKILPQPPPEKHLMSPLKAIRTFCRKQCMPEPKGEHLRCDMKDCPLWRHRVGNPRLWGRGPTRVSASGSPSVAAARGEILNTDSEAKQTGKCHFTPHGTIQYDPRATARQAIRKHCVNCMGNSFELVRQCVAKWPDPDNPKVIPCPLYEYRMKQTKERI